MASHARPKAPKTAQAPAALLRAGFLVAAAGAALGASGAATASAAPVPARTTPASHSVLDAPVMGTTGSSLGQSARHSVRGMTRPATSQELDPLAATRMDPLSNGSSTQVGDFAPISTQPVMGPIDRGASLGDLNSGPAAHALPGIR